MKDYNQKLNSSLLTDLGFQFMGTEYEHPKFGFSLIITDQPNKYLVTLKDKKLDLNNKMQPVGNYSELIRTIFARLNPYLQREMQKRAPFINDQVEVQTLLKLMEGYFLFDRKLKFNLEISPMGLQIKPNNEYTYSLMSGNIERFHVTYIGDSETQYIEFDIDPFCVSYEYIIDVIHSETNHMIEEIKEVRMLSEDKPFFGNGLRFVKDERLLN